MIQAATMIPGSAVERRKTMGKGSSGGRQMLNALAKHAVLAAKIEQRLAVTHDDVLDFGDKDSVIARVLRSVQAAFKVSQRAVQNGRTVLGAFKAGACFFGGAVVGSRWTRVVFRNRPLIFGENVHAKTLLGMKMSVRAGALVDAHQHQHRIERYRGECVRGHAVDFVFGVQRDHGDAGRKASESLAEVGLAYAHSVLFCLRLTDTLTCRSSVRSKSHVDIVLIVGQVRTTDRGDCKVAQTLGRGFHVSFLLPARFRGVKLHSGNSRILSHASEPKPQSGALAESLADVRSGQSISRDIALQFLQCSDELLPHLLAAARGAKEQFKPGVITYSRKVFLPLTNLCRDYCGYCIFRKDPGDPGAHTMTPDEVLEVVRQGEELGCTEALFSLGDKPELIFPEMRESLRRLGYHSTLQYLEAMCELVLRETSVLPHPNPGLMSAEWITRLAAVSPSMGLMLETTNANLLGRGLAHDNAPDKLPSRRLRVMEDAGKQRVPFTTGMLIGIGESLADRVDTLLAIREMHDRYGHIQEVIVQNFRAKPGIPMQNWPEPPLGDMLRTVAVARLLMPRVNIQAPPNLSAPYYDDLLEAGINDWGGVSPLTPDFINPEKPWPHLEQLRRRTESRGFILEQRLPVYPEFVPMVAARPGLVADRLRTAADPRGYSRRAA
jgi:7,8-didemethyl-8-hydroxy-5-deazariboflavin synthase CofG subunit